MQAEQVKQALRPLIDQIKRESFVKDYNASDAEAFGLLVSKFFGWAGEPILDVAAFALEDANFHKEAEIIWDLK